MKNIIRNILWAIIIFPFFISIFMIDHFLFWLLFGCYVCLIGLLLLVIGLFSKLMKIEGNIKRFFTRLYLLVFGIGMLAFFWIVWSSSFLDVNAYFSKDYKTIKGFPSHIGSRSSKSLFQTIEINKIELKSVYEINYKDIDKEFEALYLPNSKYVIRLWKYK